MIMQVIRLFAFLLSSCGYMALGKDKLNVEDECLPICTFSCIGCTVFIAGLLNIMYGTFLTIFGMGVLLFVYYVVKKRECIPKSFGLVFWFFFSVILFLALVDEKYYEFDNLTHWGLVVKNMYYDMEFPNFQDTFIYFQTYPLGSASFIWYVCRCIGYSEGITMFAQNILILSCACPFFLILKNKKGKRIIGCIIASIICMIAVCGGNNFANGPFTLLVDKLLAYIAIAAFVIVYYYKESLMKATVVILPLLAFVIVVKNSGIMWVAAILFEVVYFGIRNKYYDRTLLEMTGLLVAVPTFLRLLWDKHVELVFESSSLTYHAMNADNYSTQLANKSLETIRQIKEMFFNKVFTWHNEYFALLVFFVISYFVFYILDKQILEKTDGIFIFFYLLTVYIIYQIGNYVMYIVSMPVTEAMYLAGYERYVATVTWFAWGIVIMVLLTVLAQIESSLDDRIFIGIVGLLALLILYPEAAECISIFRHQVPQNEAQAARDRLEEIVDDYHIRPYKKCLVYISNTGETDGGYRGWMANYVLNSGDVSVVSQSQIKKMDQYGEYDYLIILERDELVDTYLNSRGLSTDEDCIVIEELSSS